MSSNTNSPPLSREFLQKIFSVKSPPSPSPQNGVVSTDVTVDPARDLWFRLYVPSTNSTSTSGATTLPVIVYFHGGGFVSWSPDSKPYDDLCRKLAVESPAVVVSVNYRLAPAHRCPAPYEDGFEVLSFLDRHSAGNIDGFPAYADVGKCIVAGDSAGGNIAHHVAVKACEYDQFQAIKVIGLIPIQPFFAATERTESELRLTPNPVSTLKITDMCWSLFLPDGSDRDHPAASVFGPKGKDITHLERFPPTLVFTGGLDPFQDWGRKYYEWLIKSGKSAKLVHYPNAPHAFYSIPEMPDYSSFISEVKEFVLIQLQAT